VLRFYDFFAGAGLAELGLGEAWKCIWANDIDSRKAEVYEANFRQTSQFFVGDVAGFTGRDLPNDSQLAWASFPCQDLSLAGWRRGISADRSGAFWAFWRIMHSKLQDGCRPPVIVIENVVGLLYGDSFSGLCEALAALGMQFGALVLDARHFVPQSRPRVFVVAADARIDCSAFAAESAAQTWSTSSLSTAHDNLPWNLKSLWRWWRLPEPPPRRGRLGNVIEDAPTGVHWHTREETDYILSLMSETNLEKIRDAQRCGTRQVGFMYRRIRQGVQRAEVRFDGISGCLRTPRGGSSRQTVIIVEGERIRSRLLSPREAARLMGVPDSFKLPTNYNDAYKAMGDAVVVPVVRWLSENLLVPLTTAAVRLPLNGHHNPHIHTLQEVTERRASVWTETTRGAMRQIEEKALEVLKSWFEKEQRRKRTSSDVYIVCAGLAVLQATKEVFPVSDDDFITEGNQVKTGGPFIKKILMEFGEERLYSREGGRTTRGTVPAATRLVEQMNGIQEFAKLTNEDRATVAKGLQRWLYENGVLPYFQRKSLEIEIAVEKPGPQIIADILDLAREKNQGGCVAQHLVGAKLCLRLGQALPNHSCTTSDQQLGRSGDFLINDTAIHVTVSPQSSVIDKCEENIGHGYRALLLVPEDRLEAARQLLEQKGLERRIAQPIEQWVGQNIEEIAGFGKAALSENMRTLLEKYNQRVSAVESDRSLLVRIPENL
jgi:DNA (cytosine-5)-methyltransferase 1